jgi:hypothetical protein
MLALEQVRCDQAGDTGADDGDPHAGSNRVILRMPEPSYAAAAATDHRAAIGGQGGVRARDVEQKRR